MQGLGSARERERMKESRRPGPSSTGGKEGAKGKKWREKRNHRTAGGREREREIERRRTD